MEEHQAARDLMAAHLRDCNERERHDAKVIRGILDKHANDHPESNVSSHDLDKEELEVVGRFLMNRTDVRSFRQMAAEYLQWVSSLSK